MKLLEQTMQELEEARAALAAEQAAFAAEKAAWQSKRHGRPSCLIPDASTLDLGPDDTLQVADASDLMPTSTSNTDNQTEPTDGPDSLGVGNANCDCVSGLQAHTPCKRQYKFGPPGRGNPYHSGWF